MRGAWIALASVVAGIGSRGQASAATPPSPTKRPLVVAVRVPAEPRTLWHLVLRTANEPVQVLRDEVIPDTGGSVDLGSHSPAAYSLRVITDDGQLWATVPLGAEEIAEGKQKIISLRSVRVEGVVRAGGAVLASARLLFGGDGDAAAVATKANPNGEFEMFLPRAGRWRVTVNSDAPRLNRVVTAEVPEAEKHTALTDVQVISAGIEGTAEDEDGNPVRRAAVSAQLAGERTSTESDVVDGSFRLEKLLDGEYFVRARIRPGLESERVFVVVEHGLATPALLSLVVKKAVGLRGRVTTSRGAPIAGAEVYSFVDVLAGAPSPPVARTDEDGGFKLFTPPGLESACIAVFPLAQAGVVTRIATGGDEAVIVIPEQGGSVTLDVPPWNAIRLNGRQVVVVSGSCPVPPFLFRYGRRHRLEDRGDRWIHHLANVGPGHYSACALAPTELAGFMGSVPPDAPCVSGDLGPGSSLSLQLLK